MTKLLLALALCFSSQAIAHGPVVEQASKSVQKVTALFLAEEKPETTTAFQSIAAEQAGEERFLVRITLKKSGALEYSCGLDETTKPFKWGCRRK